MNERRKKAKKANHFRFFKLWPSTATLLCIIRTFINKSMHTHAWFVTVLSAMLCLQFCLALALMGCSKCQFSMFHLVVLLFRFSYRGRLESWEKNPNDLAGVGFWNRASHGCRNLKLFICYGALICQISHGCRSWICLSAFLCLSQY